MLTISLARVLEGKKTATIIVERLTQASLSAIMLGRLKMTVAKSMDLYQIIGERVFKHARKLAHKQVKYIYPAFNSGRMEKAMREATVLGKMQSDAKTKMGTAYVTNESAEKTLMRDENQESSRTYVFPSK